MANFFLIDQSLQDFGGHHYDYVRCVASAAQEQGYLTTIGTHASFCNDQALRKFGSVKRVFRQTTYQRDSYLSGLRHLTRSRCDYLNDDQARKRRSYHSLIGRWRCARHKHRRKKNIRRFAQDCERFFGNVLLTESDHAFFATVNEMEFMGLAAYLANQPRTLQVTWHLQFHFNLFEGRTPEYQSQHQVARAIQGCFDAALARIPYHQLNFYATSEALADQFNRLSVGNFEVLAYPIRPELFQKPATKVSIRAQQTPIRITCPGEVRREKRIVEYLQPLVDEIWNRHLSTGKVQIVVQRPNRKWPAREKISLQPPKSPHLTAANNEWVQYFSHPLSDQEYFKLINSTDCGLLFYDSRAYFSRRAGVLGELLSCGKPVIVPAGSWLADQIQEPNFQHVSSLIQQKKPNRILQLNDMQWTNDNVPLTGGVLSFDQNEHPFELEFELESGENNFVVQFDWHWPRSRGVYCKLESDSIDDAYQTATVRVLGHRHGNLPAMTLFQSSGKRVRLRLSNAFHDSTASVKNISIHTLALMDDRQPFGSVGIIAADETDIPAAIDEIVDHYEHYRRTATQFAKRWCLRHEPRRTVSHLISANVPLDRAS